MIEVGPRPADITIQVLGEGYEPTVEEPFRGRFILTRGFGYNGNPEVGEEGVAVYNVCPTYGLWFYESDATRSMRGAIHDEIHRGTV